MKTPCPHCNQPTISGWRKINATSIRPAECQNCGEKSYVSGWSHALVAISFEVSIWGSIILALILKSWYPLLISPLGIAIALLTYSSNASLIPTDSKKISQARIRAAFELLSIVSIIIAGYLLFGNEANAI
jgi:hypothetical protein